MTEIVAVIKVIRDLGALGGWSLLALFVYMSATKRVAWWYQIQEREQTIEKLEARCGRLEAMLFRHLDINERSIDALSSPAVRVKGET